ncbi:MAG: L-threonylcarbamoyladenylate synthase [Rickettsiales bacterium]|jgi:L-threonylcarbamoyladenylate synthase
MKKIKECDPQAATLVAKVLKNDGVVCFATETVYALTCNAVSDKAVAKLYAIKKRDPEKPISVFVKDIKMAEKFLHFNKIEKEISAKFMPGMITLVLKKKNTDNLELRISPLLSKSENLGLRIPDHKFCLDLLNEFDGIIAATSANPSGKDSAINFNQAWDYFNGKVDLIIDGGICVHKIASTVLKVDGGIKIIRSGSITKNQLENL